MVQLIPYMLPYSVGILSSLANELLLIMQLSHFQDIAIAVLVKDAVC